MLISLQDTADWEQAWHHVLHGAKVLACLGKISVLLKVNELQ